MHQFICFYLSLCCDACGLESCRGDAADSIGEKLCLRGRSLSLMELRNLACARIDGEAVNWNANTGFEAIRSVSYLTVLFSSHLYKIDRF